VDPQIVVRWSGEGDTGRAIDAVQWAGFVDGHSGVFSNEELEVVRQNKPGHGWDFTWRSILPGNQLTAVAVEGAQIVGAITVWRPSVQEGYSIVEPMNVLRRYRRQGIGSRVWRFIESHSTERRDRGLRVWAINGNQGAIQFYGSTLKLQPVGVGTFWIGEHRESATEFRHDFEPDGEPPAPSAP
jgi:GNAT superfamily N-acetyltransferase